VNEVAAGSVGAESDGMVGPTQVGLVLGVSVDGSELRQSVSELALLAVLAGTVFLVRPAQLRLVAACVDLGRRQRSCRQSYKTFLDCR